MGRCLQSDSLVRGQQVLLMRAQEKLASARLTLLIRYPQNRKLQYVWLIVGAHMKLVLRSTLMTPSGVDCSKGFLRTTIQDSAETCVSSAGPFPATQAPNYIDRRC